MKYKLPLWLKNIENAIQYDSVFIVHGQEIKDDVVLPENTILDNNRVGYADLGFKSFGESMNYVLARSGFDAVVSYDINRRFTVEALSERTTVNKIKALLSSELKVNFDDPMAEFFQNVPELIVAVKQSRHIFYFSL
jgi:hypothetical protein